MQATDMFIFFICIPFVPFSIFVTGAQGATGMPLVWKGPPFNELLA